MSSPYPPSFRSNGGNDERERGKSEDRYLLFWLKHVFCFAWQQVHHKIIDFNRDARQAGSGDSENKECSGAPSAIMGPAESER